MNSLLKTHKEVECENKNCRGKNEMRNKLSWKCFGTFCKINEFDFSLRAKRST